MKRFGLAVGRESGQATAEYALLLALVAAGLLVALASGIPPLLRGWPYMTGLWLKVPLPVVGKVGSPVIFDVGVYLVVLGIVLAILFALAEEEP